MIQYKISHKPSTKRNYSVFNRILDKVLCFYYDDYGTGKKVLMKTWKNILKSIN